MCGVHIMASRLEGKCAIVRFGVFSCVYDPQCGFGHDIGQATIIFRIIKSRDMKMVSSEGVIATKHAISQVRSVLLV